MGRAKRVKLTAAHFTPRPDGKVSYERQDREKEILCHRATIFGNTANSLVYDPGEKQRIPKDGAWVMITRELPPMEKNLQKHIRVARVFYAEHDGEADEFGFLPDGSYKVVCRSPWADMKLWPYEYSTIDAPSLLDLWQSKEMIFHPMNVQLARFNDIVFYARSRGIGLPDAMVMALGTFKGPVGWFEPTRKLAREAEAMERSVHREWKPRRTLKTPMQIELEVK